VPLSSFSKAGIASRSPRLVRSHAASSNYRYSQALY
jgi:hypothetical protein